jgi:hypothetical protein
MAGASNISTMNTEFEDFLFALVGEQKNGMPVSIFSALSRLDIDPWREAKRLSDLPKDRAIQTLRDSIERLADLEWAKIDAAGIAASLIRLLPNHGGRARPPAPADDAVRARRAQDSISSNVVSVASNLSLSAWLAIGAAVLIALYVLWPGDAPSQGQGRNVAPSSYDNPVREQPRR